MTIHRGDLRVGPSRTTIPIVAVVLVLVGLSAARLEAQVRPDPLARPLAAYRDLDYDAAARALRSALTDSTATRLEDPDRRRALMYLGAVEVFRGQQAAAVEVFRELLLRDPLYRPDELVFPPEVLQGFGEARRRTRAAIVSLAALTEISAPSDRLVIRLRSSTPHEIRASILDPEGGPVRVLYEGAIGDSLAVEWNGRDGLGRLRDPGTYQLRVASKAPDGKEEREVRVPLRLQRVAEDTLAWPAPLDPAGFRVEQAPAIGGSGHLVRGVAAALAVVGMPAIAGAGSDGGGARLGVAAALVTAGIIGHRRARAPQPIPENIAYNQRLRDRWAAEAARVRATNESRRVAVLLRIEPGVPVRTELP